MDRQDQRAGIRDLARGTCAATPPPRCASQSKIVDQSGSRHLQRVVHHVAGHRRHAARPTGCSRSNGRASGPASASARPCRRACSRRPPAAPGRPRRSARSCSARHCRAAGRRARSPASQAAYSRLWKTYFAFGKVGTQRPFAQHACSSRNGRCADGCRTRSRSRRSCRPAALKPSSQGCFGKSIGAG